MGKWALITGASGGIGQAIARKMAKEGYHLYLHYHTNDHAIKHIIDEVDVEVYPICADLSTSDGVSALLRQLHHSIDVLIHNSGMSFFGLMTDMNDDEINKMIHLHITSPFKLTKEILPNMIKKRKGHVIMITSIWGLTGASCEVLYSMVKGAQNTFVKALAKEVAPSGVYVNGVAPGAIETKMMSGFTVDELSAIKEDIPMNRLGQPNEVADAVNFLVSDDASYINGQILSVNGGWYT